MIHIGDYRKIARESLRGRWGMAVVTGVTATLLGASTSMSVGRGSIARQGKEIEQFRQSDFYYAIQPYLPMIATVTLLWILLMLVLSGAVTLGYARFNLKLADQKQAEFADLFSQFGRLWEGFCMQFFQMFLIFLWSLLFILPGVIACYRYAMTSYILSEDLEIPVMEAIDRSKKMMNGHKWELFCLNMSFLGWIFLSILTLGIGFLWLKPYQEAARAVFYREVSEQRYSRASMGQE